LARLNWRRHWTVLAVIILLGGILRGFYLAESVKKSDFAAPIADAAFHDYWARALVTGDWSPPAQNPNPYINTTPFVRPPGYPYFLALTYALTGKSYVGARIVQLALGLVNCWLAYLLASRVLNRKVGLVLAALMAVYWALIYIEIELHDPVLLIALSLTFFLVMHRWLHRPTLWRVAVGGLLLGTMVLVRPNVAVFLPLAIGWVWWRRRLMPAAVLAGAALVAILPATIRNLAVADDLVMVSANGAINLYIGNNPGADGITTRIPDLQELIGQSGWSCFSFDLIVQGVSERVGKPLKYSEVDRYFLKRGLQEIARDPFRFLSLTARRAALFWGPAEISNNKVVAVEKSESKVLRYIPGFPVILALALLGGAMLWHDRRRPVVAKAGVTVTAPGDGRMLALVLMYVGAVFVSYLPFLIAERFRIPVVPYVLLFSAYGLYRLGQAASARSWALVAKLAVAAVALVLLCNHPWVEYKSDRSAWHTDQGVALGSKGDMVGAIREYRAALRENPGFVDAHVGLANALAATGQYQDAISHFQTVVKNRPTHLEARTGLAAALTLSGNPAAAVTELRTVLAQSPNSAQAHFELGRALGGTGQLDEAERELRESLRLAEGYGFAHVALGNVLARKGDHRGAIEQYRQALLIDTKDALANRWLGESLCAVDSMQAGTAAFERALALQPRDPAPAEQFASLHFNQRRMAEAERWFRRAVQIAPGKASTHANLALTLANLGRYDAAATEMREAIRLDPRNQVWPPQLRQIEAQLQPKR
jgi:tetratricopeptide (TPR) repeat protein